MVLKDKSIAGIFAVPKKLGSGSALIVFEFLMVL